MAIKRIKITKEQATDLIFSTDREGHIGRLFTAVFTKRDGSERVMKARLGIQRNLTGKGQSYVPESRGLITVWEANNGYRMLNINTLKELVVHNSIYQIGA